MNIGDLTAILSAAGMGVLGAAWGWLAWAAPSAGEGLPATQPEAAAPVGAGQPERLAVIWSSGDPEVAHKVCLMFTHAAGRNKWFGEVRLIVWGPSAKLLAGDEALQKKLKTMLADGIGIEACIACSDSYGVSDKLRELGLDVKPMGRPLSEYLKSGWRVLTF